jgi:hypothetical protein
MCNPVVGFETPGALAPPRPEDNVGVAGMLSGWPRNGETAMKLLARILAGATLAAALAQVAAIDGTTLSHAPENAHAYGIPVIAYG